MKNEMTKNTYLSTNESKNKLSKQEEWRQDHRYKECSNGHQMEGGDGGMDEEVRGLRNTNR